MGKGITGVLALCSAGLLGVLILAPHLSVALTVAMLLGIVVASAAAWCIALMTAVNRLLHREGSLRAVIALVIFFWVPVVPAFCYGVSGVPSIFRRKQAEPRAKQRRAVPAGAQQTVAPVGRKQRFTLPPVDDLVLSTVRTSSRRQA